MILSRLRSEIETRQGCMDDANSYVASLLGFGKREPKPEPKISKVAAIAILKIKEALDAKILVFCNDVETVSAEIRSFFGRGVQRHSSEKGFSQIHFLNGSIVLMTPTLNTDRLCGVRGNYLIIEGKKSEVNQQFFYEVAVPFMSISFDPSVRQKLEQLCGESLSGFAKKNEIIFTEGE